MTIMILYFKFIHRNQEEKKLEYNEVICLYLKDYLSDEQFEEYFYNNITEFEEHLEEDIYLEIISTNFNLKEEKINLKTKLKKYILDNFFILYDNINDAHIENLIQSGIEGYVIEILRGRYSRRDLVSMDCSNIKNQSELIHLIKETLKFPEFCGNNWNAIQDLIYDINLPKKIVLSNWDAIEKQLPKDSILARRIFDSIDENYCIVLFN